MHPLLPGAAAIVPIVTNHALYAPASIAMLEILRRSVFPGLARLQTVGQESELAELRFHLLQLQFMLAQIADVERNQKGGQE